MNPIRSYGNAFVNPYTQAARPAQPAAAPQPERTTMPPAVEPPATPPADRPAAGSALTPAEEQMIGEQFPASPTLSMRLYGPSGAARTASAAALGSRLDLVG